jgi:TolB protein
LVILLLAALIAISLAGAARPAPPFGLARPGLIAFDATEGVVVARGDGTDRAVLVPADGQAINPTWSRDGLRMAFWHRPGDTGPWALNVIDADGSARRVLARGVSLRSREALINQPSNLSWSPDSRRLAFAGDVSTGSAIFVVDREDPGPAQLVDGSLKAIDPAWSPDGSVIAFQSEVDRTLHVVAPDGTGERLFSWLTGTELWPEWSPDGRALVVAARVHGNFDIFTVSANGSIVTNVSNAAADEFSPSWSPDGQRLAWAQATGETTRGFVVVANADGSGKVVIAEPADLAPPIWSPDGTRVYSYVLGADDAFQYLIVLDPAGIAPVVRIPVRGNLGNGNWQRLP